MEWRPMGVGDLLDAAFRGYRRFFIPCLVAYLLFCLPGVAGQAGLTAISTLLPEISMNAALLALTMTIPLTILTSLLVGLAEAVCASAVLTGFKGGSVTTGNALAGIRGRWWRLMGLVCLKSLLIGLGSLLCIVPGIILAINYAVAVPVAVAEDLPVMASLRRSRDLVQESKGKTFGLLFLLWLFQAIFSWALLAAFYGAAAFAAGRFNPFFIGAVNVAGWGQVIVLAATRLLVPLGGLLWAYYYVDLRARREAFDLTSAVEGLPTAPDINLPQ